MKLRSSLDLTAAAKRFARIVLGEYSAYYIYTCSNPDVPRDEFPKSDFVIQEVDATGLSSSRDQLIRQQASYAGGEAQCYGCILDDRVVGVCCYWYGNRYLKRNYWPLRNDEAKLVQIITLPEMRGRGVATALIHASFRDMFQRGFRRSYARVWHSNVPSLKAFHRAGWSRVALVIEINPLRLQHPFRICLPLTRKDAYAEGVAKSTRKNALS